MTGGALLHVAEPPAQYLLRPPLVVDCSVIAGTLFGEEWRDEADRQTAARDLHAPYFLQSEFASVAVKKSRRGLHHEAMQALERFGELDIELHRIDTTAVVALALRYQLSAYDAAYLWLAADLKCPLATFDDKLAAAAHAHLATLE